MTQRLTPPASASVSGGIGNGECWSRSIISNTDTICHKTTHPLISLFINVHIEFECI
jgi:hypothetical protein